MNAQRRYGLRDSAGPSPPDYGRVVGRLSDDELRAELEGARGRAELTGYREALQAELERRDIDPRGGRR